jgi:hypothetical protein
MSDTTVKTEHVAPTVIKNEPDLDGRGHNGFYGAPRVTSIVKTTSHEVIEISDSEDEQPAHPKEEEPAHPKEEEPSTHFIAWTKGQERGGENSQMGGNEQMPSSFPFEPSMFTKESGTIWTDSDVMSLAVEGAFQVTKEVQVDRVEYLTDIPSVWPIPKLPTAFILDLRDDRKYLLHKNLKPGSIDTRTQTLATPDFLIKNKVSIF